MKEGIVGSSITVRRKGMIENMLAIAGLVIVLAATTFITLSAALACVCLWNLIMKEWNDDE